MSEPVAWLYEDKGTKIVSHERWAQKYPYTETPLYASPSAQPIAREPTELTDDMLRYAMAAMGTGKWEDAERFNQFWKFAMEAALKSTGKEST